MQVALLALKKIFEAFGEGVEVIGFSKLHFNLQFLLFGLKDLVSLLFLTC